MIETSHVLAVGAHVDDIELGAGGLISKLVAEGAKVTCVAFSSCAESLPPGFSEEDIKEETTRSMERLGVWSYTVLECRVRWFHEARQEILEHLVSLRQPMPTVVLCPCGADVHQDHSVVHAETIRAFKDTTVLGYELPWNCVEGSARFFVTLSKEDMQNKLEALAEYASQAGKSYMQSSALQTWARSIGFQVGREFAERFEVIRCLV